MISTLHVDPPQRRARPLAGDIQAPAIGAVADGFVLREQRLNDAQGLLREHIGQRLRGAERPLIEAAVSADHDVSGIGGETRTGGHAVVDGALAGACQEWDLEMGDGLQYHDDVRAQDGRKGIHAALAIVVFRDDEQPASLRMTEQRLCIARPIRI